MKIFKEIIFTQKECDNILKSNKKENVIEEFQEYKERIENSVRKFRDDIFSPIFIFSWIMRYEKGEGGPWHIHRGIKEHSLSANIFLSGNPNVGIWIRDKNSGIETLHKNEIGQIVIMDCDVFHKPEINYSLSKRCVLGMTIHDADMDFNFILD